MTKHKGFVRFHRNAFFNYQFNRWWRLGGLDPHDLADAAKCTSSFSTAATAFTELAQARRKAGALREAAFATRAAEFFTNPDDGAKRPLYDTFRDEFYASSHYEPETIPYGPGILPLVRLSPARGASRGTILAFGGFDSCMEEFFDFWSMLANHGFTIYAFEGPGQGAALRQGNLLFDHDWEKPVGAVLDYLGLEKAALIGMSMGGYWALRAAAHEPRIGQVIAMPPVYDWLATAGAPVRALVRAMVRSDALMNASIALKRRAAPVRHLISHVQFISSAASPAEAVRWMLAMNADHLASAQIRQHVLLLGGRRDLFQPPKLLQYQAQALPNAASVTTRIFTRQEHAAEHCQIGNLALVADYIGTWLNQHLSEET